MTHKHIRFVGFLLGLLLATQLFAQPSVDNGKTLFRNYCATCHAKDMKTASTGPALAGTEERWADYPREDLYAWIRNSQALIQAGHPRATELWAQWQPTVMTAWPNLTDEDVESILLYIKDVEAGPKDAGLAAAGGDQAGGDTKSPYTWLYIVLFGLLIALSLVLTKIISSLDTIVAAKEGNSDYVEKPFLRRVFNKQVTSLLLFSLIVFLGYTTVTRAIGIGRQQGYAPEQPIKFSHATHAGENGIDCQYCHDGARRSKHAVIPATNTCMNCHSAIKNGSKFGTAELTKIYVSSGYDPSTNKYIEGYEQLKPEEVEGIYKKWITDQYLADAGINSLDKKGKKHVEEQWDNIVSSLTNDMKEDVRGPIEWTRVHNLPDHVYFNHAQHVTVGGLECQTCHGTVEEMEVLGQHAPLSMGWCINCHRQTEVDFKGNEYYASYELYHEQLAKGEKEKITVEDIGGLECQKCHY